MPRSAGSSPTAWIALSALVAVLTPAPALAHPGVGALAQGGDRRASLELIDQEVWLPGPASPLGLRLRVTNTSPEPLPAIRLTVRVGERLQSRSALHETFEDPESFLLDSAYTRFRRSLIRPGEAVTIDVQDAAGTLDTLERATEGGVYPLAIHLYDDLDQELDVVTTQVIYYPSRPVDPLNLVLVVPLSDLPARAPSGSFERDPLLGTWPLEEALGPEGWLRGILVALRRHPRLQLGLAPTPRLLEEIADMRNGYVRSDGSERQVVEPGEAPAAAAAAFIEGLRQLLRRPRVQPLRVPYAAPDLIALNDNPAELWTQLTEATDVLTAVLGAAGAFDQSWLFAPGGRLDAETLDALRLFAVASRRRFKTFLAPDAVTDTNPSASAGCARPLLTFSCPVLVQGPTEGFVSDAGLADRFEALARDGNDRADLQRLFAETATIREEIPGESGRVVHTTVPALWHPAPRLIADLFTGLASAPWLETLTPSEALALDTATVAGSTVRQADPAADAPGHDYYESIARAATAIDNFSLIGPDPGLLQRLERNVLVAQSQLWWGDASLRARGESYAAESASEVRAQFSNITIGGRGEITLTSRRQSIPLVLFNDNPYPVRVEVHLNSPDLDFDKGSVLRRKLDEGNYPLTIQATALSSGAFALEVSLYPPGSDYRFRQTEIVVRSTEFNKIALGITIGALAFLFLFYALRAVRRRRDRPGGAPPGAAAA